MTKHETMDVVTISGATLKVTLGGLGLPPSWFAEQLHVTMRTVVRWFDGEKVPAKAAAKVQALHDATLDEMRDMIERTDTGNGSVALKTYRTDKSLVGMPASWHRALTFRVMEHLRAQGHQVTVEYEE